jgi:hypothetical protein
MDLTAEVATLIAIASLIVSAFSVVYARKAYQFEQRKFALEQAKQDLVITMDTNLHARLRDNYVIVSNFSVHNGTSAAEYIRHAWVTVEFKEDKIWSSRYVRISFDANGGKGSVTWWGSFDRRFLDVCCDQIQVAMMDANINTKLSFSANHMVGIESMSQAYAWRAYIVVPSSLMQEIEFENGLEPRRVEVGVVLHPSQRKTARSTDTSWPVFPAENEELSVDVLSRIFPGTTFEHR